jgi:hypothetical protein
MSLPEPISDDILELSREQERDARSLVERWNRAVPVGSRVLVTRDNGEIQECHTRARADLIGTKVAVIWLTGITGCYLLDRCTPIVGPVTETTS